MQRVFSRSGYVAAALILALITFLLVSWVPLAPFMLRVLQDASLPLSEALRIIGDLLVALIIGAPFTELLYTGTLSILFGINVALLVFYFKMFRAAPSVLNLGSGALGIVSALFGFGCTACGVVFASALFATIGGTGFLAALPFKGAEFGSIALFFLSLSIYTLARAINKPVVCPI